MEGTLEGHLKGEKYGNGDRGEITRETEVEMQEKNGRKCDNRLDKKGERGGNRE